MGKKKRRGKKERGRKGKKVRERESKRKRKQGKQREIRRISGRILEMSIVSKNKPCASGKNINTMIS